MDDGATMSARGRLRKPLEWLALGASRARWLFLGILAALPPLFVLGLLLPSSGGWGMFGSFVVVSAAVVAGTAAVATVGVLGLVVLHARHVGGYRPRAVLGVITGVFGAALAVVGESMDAGIRGADLPFLFLLLLVGGACGWLGAWIYWVGELRIQAGRDLTALTASISPEDRLRFASRLDRDHW